MAAFARQTCFWSFSVLRRQSFIRSLCTSQIQSAGSQWRLENGLGKCGNEYGPLVEIPDWSYLDGRPAPLGEREIKRREKTAKLAKQAVQYIDEMKTAKSNNRKKMNSKRNSSRVE